MNLRTLMCVLGAFGVLAFSTACEIKEGTGGAGGTGGDDGGTGGMAGGGQGGMGGAGGMGGMGGGMAACYDKNPGCSEYITLEVEDPWCDEDPNFTPGSNNPSYDIYDKLAQCTCDLDMNPATGGKCAELCKDEACAGKPVVSGGECQKCITDTAAGCGAEFNNCANDA